MIPVSNRIPSAISKKKATPIKRVAMIGNHTPRQCGIGTFTADLIESFSAKYPGADCFAVAMNDRPEGYDYPPEVRLQIAQNDLASYRSAALYLNSNEVDVVCLQHEYGIFGGEAGSHILTLLRALKMPIITTLHTILKDPNADQRRVMTELAKLSDRLVVMSQCGAKFLQEVHQIDPSKIDVIPHGIPDLPETDSEAFKAQLNVSGKSVLLTFGLLSPDKGVENVIEAMPAILEKFPDVAYVVLGATHPHIRTNHGEAYRESLLALAERLGVSDNVHFHNKFATLEELTQMLSVADIYLTPYLKPEQITSGTLAYAVGSGKVAISTPYYYAEELLSEGRGILVPWRNPEAIANEVIGLLGDPEKRKAIENRAFEFGRKMTWPAVAGQFMETFQHAVSGRATLLLSVSGSSNGSRNPGAVVKSPKVTRLSGAESADEIGDLFPDLPAINLTHLRQMTDDTGLTQHATYNIPDYDEGYCVDDNARALILATLMEELGGEYATDVGSLSTRYLAFVKHSLNANIGRFRNFMSYDRRWLEEKGAEDSHGRTLWALGTVAGRSRDSGKISLATHLFFAGLQAVADFTSPRAMAFTLLGIDEAFRIRTNTAELERMRDLLANRLFRQFQSNSSPDWQWLEDSVTYSNARLSQSLLVSGRSMGCPEMIAAGYRSLKWLAALQTSEDGCFTPVGSNGFFLRGGVPAKFDQQPVEACGMVSASLEAWRMSGEEFWLGEAKRAFAWFLGENELGSSLYDPVSGGCCDGIHPDRINVNQGAESTLSFLLALAELKRANLKPNRKLDPQSKK